MKDHQSKHIPVLLNEVIDLLAPEKGENLLDATAGYGGHATAILKKTKQPKTSYLVDRDKYAVEELTKVEELHGVQIVHSDFAQATKVLHQDGRQFDIILADLGVSSPHLDIASRGFSFNNDGPLDMRMDTSKGLTAADVVNTSSQEAIKEIIKKYGEEPNANKIAQAIVENRPFSTTSELANAVAETVPRRGRIHPATKTFQALRIVVNDELAQLRYTLPLWVSMLNQGGRIGIISFHSLEDRIVKDIFQDLGGDRYDADIKILTKKPVMAGDQELVFNPRARSAKLRVAVKK